MTYEDYRKAAERHLNTCKCLLKSNQSDDCQSSHESLLQNVVYLSGYVMECQLKYLLLLKMGIDRNQEINNHPERQNWQTHDLQKLRNKIEQRGLSFPADIPFFGSRQHPNTKIKSLFNYCKNELSNIRYEFGMPIDFDLVKDYLEEVKILNDRLQRMA